MVGVIYCIAYILSVFVVVTHCCIFERQSSSTRLSFYCRIKETSKLLLVLITNMYLSKDMAILIQSRLSYFYNGFPSSFHSWRHQLEYFSRQNFDCLAPNLMGYGKTYSPMNKDEYKCKTRIEHLVTLLDHLNIKKVIVIGHDWGTRVASRFVLYHPERTLGVTLISGGYSAPALFDLDRALEASKQAIGYETLGYWKFFEADDAAKIIENNLESFIDLAFASNPILWKTDFAPVGKSTRVVNEWE